MRTYVMNRGAHDSLDSIFGSALNGFIRPFIDKEDNLMKTDIRELADGISLEMELPGFAKSDIHVDFEDGYLVVSAKKEVAGDEDSAVKFLRRERYTSYRRSFYVGDIDETLVTAKYENGVLTLVVPSEQKKPEKKGIEIL